MLQKIKKRFSFVFILFLVFNILSNELVVFPMNQIQYDSSGVEMGTISNPFLISNRTQLANISQNLSAYYKLTNDIDLQSVEWTPIGNNSAPFVGNFDGDNHQIKNIKVTGSKNYVGLFGYLQNATVKNVEVAGGNVSGNSYVSAITGYSQSSTINNAGASNVNVTGASYVSGIAGQADSSTIIGGYVSGNGSVKGTGYYVGAVAGWTNGTTITASYETVPVQGSIHYVGGLVGYSASGSDVISESYSTGNVIGGSSYSYTGGLVGYLNGKVKDSFSTSNVTGNAYIGGLVGAYGTVTNSYAAGTVVSSHSNKGAITGYSTSVTNSYFDTTKSGFTAPTNMAKTTAMLLHKDNYVNFDFNKSWVINEGGSYAYLKNAKKPDAVTAGIPVYASGEGTVASPYIIKTPQQLKTVSFDLTGHYKLGDNIDLTNQPFIALGDVNSKFTGSFDGAEFKIKNLNVTTGNLNYRGLFGYAQNATIRNVALENVEISGNTYVGALVGQADGGKIENCSISGTGNVKGNNYTGALVGVSSSALTSNTTNVAVSGVSYVGGLVGQSTGVLSKNYSTGAVSATTSQVGGLVGYNTSTISDSFALGSVTGSSYTGGLIGQNNGTLQRSYSSGKVKASSSFGGLVGTGTATNSYFDAISAQVDLTASNGFSYARLTNVMKKQETFATWDFANTWEIDTGASYPYLKNLAKPKNVTDGLPQDVVANGDGTAENPYLISTVAHLQNVKYDLSAYYKLTNDIDLQSVEWTPIGNNSAPFVGNFDGDNHQIKNIKVTGSKNYVGLFGYLQNATVKNVEVAGGNVSGNSYVSAITGYSQSSTINNAGASNVNVSGVNYVSGIAGQAESSTIIGSYVSGNGSVKGTSNYVGAIAGYTSGTTITASYETVPVQGSAHYVGGLVGYATASSDVISESYSTGNVTGGSGYSYVGGLVGQLNGKVKDSFSTSTVTGTNYIGGLVGYNGTATNSYAAGTVVSAGAQKGPITGYSTSVTNSYFDTTKSGFTAPANMAKTTAMLLHKDNYVNFDFNKSWVINEGGSYAYLKNAKKPDAVTAGIPVYASGEGTVASPYIIKTPQQLKTVSFDLTGHYKLGDNIDLANQPFIALGDVNSKFTGSFDGAEFKIKNLNVTTGNLNYRGLFGYAQNATIKNVALENVEISGNTYVGALVGQADGGKIENCSISGTGNVKGNNYTGALVGVSSSALTSNTANVAVSGVSYVGGLVGQSTGVLSKNYATGTVSATSSYVGGLVGYNTSTISDSFALGSVTGSSYTGGLIGQNNGTLQRSYSSGKVKASSSFGGLVGTGTATNSYFDAISAQVDLTASNGFSYARLTNVMKKQETFATWDFANTWEIDTGASYPYLKNLAKPKNVTDGLPQDVVANGDGTAENPYLISTVAHLQNVKYDLSAYYKLTNDIDLQSVEWTPIGNNLAPFVGNFDGDNHQIKNIKVTGSKNYVGLFGYLQNATVKNVEVAGGNVSGNSYVSAITGYSQSSTINNAGASNVNVTGASYVSGIAGQADSSTIIGGYVSGNGSVKGTGYYVGAVAGWTNGTTITASYETVPVQGSIHYVGGLVGYSASGSDVISESYSTGNVIGGSSYSYTGGLVGYLNGKVKDSFSTSNVTGNAYIGGLVGAYGTVTNSYAAGTVVSSHSNKGAITGYSTSVTNSYFDTTKSGFTAPTNMAKTTAMLLHKDNYVNFDFNKSWVINEGGSYAYLKNAKKPDAVTAGIPVYASGEGTVASPYIIKTPQQLKTVSFDLTGHYKLGDNIDLANQPFIALGDVNSKFTGSFDGAEFKIKNLNVTTGNLNYRGLFGYAQNATIKNVALENVEISGNTYVGALVGQADGGKIENCSISGTGNVKGNNYTGALVGVSSSALTSNTTNVAVSGVSYVGGLVGQSTGVLSKNYSTGAVSATTSQVGGLVGYNTSTISDSFALGSVTGSSYTGGLIGQNNGTLQRSYSSGKVKASSPFGGLVGTGTATNSYFDAISAQVDLTASNGFSYARLTNVMKKQETFATWDFANTWEIDTGASYPYLKNLAKPKNVTDGLPQDVVANGDGTAENPYLISTVAHLQNVKYDLSAYYKLTNDIDLQSVEWTPIGNNSAPFVGNFDGDNHQIKNIKVTGSKNYVGLFGYLQNATVKNVEVAGGNVSGNSYVSAITGYSQSSTINNAGASNVNVSGVNYVSGIAGQAESSTIIGSYVSGNGSVKGTSNYVGAIAGYTSGTTITASYETVPVQGSAHYVGGLVGYATASSDVISESYSTGNVTGGSGYSYVGGLVGQLNGKVKDSFSTSTVTGTNYIGGLVGYNGTATNSYAAGTVVSAGAQKGPITGYSTSVTNSYFDTTKSGFTAPANMAKTTAMLLHKDNYVNFDFNKSWVINEGGSYAYLKNAKKPDAVTAGIPVYASGEGTVASPYIIKTPQQLKTVSFDLTGHYKLGDNIDLANQPFIALGDVNSKFTGSFDGAEFKIKNLNVTTGNLNYRGLFGYAQNATIKNVALENVEISGNTYVGALVGQADGGKIENCSISGTGNVKGNNYTGALVGVSSSALTSNTANVAVSGVSYVGGLVGQSTGVLSKNYATGTVSATSSYVGGLVGYNTSTISDSFALGSVTGSSYTGGLIGQNNGTLQRSYSSGKVKASSSFGGLVGTGTATNSYFDAISAQVDLTASNGFSYARLTNVMKKQETFATWDFANTWEIDTGASYPYLKNLAKPKNVTDGLPQDVVANGDGTAENPYLISTVAHLQNVKYDLSAYYKLTNDIDLQSVEWTPIGNNLAPFVGNFDGDNHQIKNIKVTGSKNYVGLFGYLQNATVKNVEVAGGNVSGNSYVSAITGYSQSSTINNAGASNVNVTGASYVSGIAGQADSSTIIGGYVSGNGSVKGTGYYVGAVAGWTNGTTITASYETVPVQGSIHYVGGLVGYSASGSDVISESYSTGNVIGGSSYSYTGGLVGYLNGKVKDSFSTSNVTGNAYIGGLVGAYGTVTNSYAAGTVVSSHSNKGAITGYSTSVTNSYFDTTKSGFTAPTNMAKTTAMLLHKDNYVNFDFNKSWVINEGGSYAYLKNAKKPDAVTAGIPVYASGEGTVASPYIIKTPQQLKTVSFDLTGHYKLGDNIDLANQPFIALGDVNSKFTGSFDGAEFKIKNLNVTTGNLNYRGLFGYAQNATIKNVALENVEISGNTYVGALVGQADGGKIENCSISGTGNVKGNNYTGALVGVSSSALTSNTTNVAVSGVSYVGGLVGQSTGVLSKNYSTGAVSATTSQVGGLVGYNTSTISDSFALGSVTGSSYTGGLIGQNNGTLQRSYSSGKVKASSSFGGLVGTGTATNSYFDAISAQVDLTASNGFSYARLTNVMKKQETFATWDFANTWEIDTGASYPYLKNLAKPKNVTDGLPQDVVANGDGTAENPYLISTVAHLQNVKYDLSAYYKLTNDIDLQSVEWTPIGNNSAPFVGNFDGDNHQIKNIKVTGSKNYVGLFGYLQNATVKNVEVAGGNVSGNSYVSAITGYSQSSTINNAGASNVNVSGVNYVSGIAGQAESSTIIGSYVSGNGSVKGTGYYVGAVAGWTNGTTITASYETVPVQGSIHYVGGLVGYSASGSDVISESYSTGNVIGGSSYSYTGGLVGYLNGKVKDSFSTSNVTGNAYIGGLVGAYGTVTNSYAAGTVVSSHSNKGAITGYSTSVTNSYFDTTKSGFTAPTNMAKTTAMLLHKDNYVNFDFNKSWVINEGGSYAYLKNAKKPDAVTAGIPVYASGEGTVASPYIIKTPQQLKTVSFDLTGHYKLGDNIDLANQPFIALGDVNSKFTGSFDGAEFKIKNLNVTTGNLNYRGLFGYAQNATIKNVALENVEISGNTYVGALVGQADGGKIENCSISGTGNVKGNNYTGALVGVSSSALTSNTANVAVSGVSYVGGLVGQSTGVLSKNYATGTVSATSSYVGGLVGYNTSTISDSFALGSVTGSSYTGGLIGQNNGTLQRSYSSGKVKASSSFGGLVGTGTATNSYFDAISAQVDLTASNGFSYARLTNVMKKQETFATWDFANTWEIDTGASYPYLKNLAKPKNVTDGLPQDVVANGDGTAENPYLISTVAHLQNVKYDLSAYYKLTNDIDLQSVEWTPIGNNLAPFVGNFDGDNHQIKNIKVTGSKNYVGLFGYLQNATVKNVEVAGGNVSGNSYVSAITGYSQSSTINNAGASNVNVTGASYVSGIAGQADSSTIIGGYVSGNGSVKGTGYYVGAVAGWTNGTTITASYETVPVQGSIHYVGGLVGYSASGSDVISESYSTGNVIGGSSYSYTGGLVGYLNGKVKDSFSTSNVTGNAYIGGLVGAYGTVTNSYAAGTVVSSHSNKGAITGYSTSVTNSYFDTTKSGFTAPTNMAKTTAMLLHKDNYVNFDFNKSWVINEGGSYAYLKNAKKPDAVTAGIPVYASGEGTVASPYIIKTPQQLKTVSFDLTGHYKLGDNIDLANQPFIALGDVNSKFTGSFDGAEFKIKNLNVTTGNLNYRGLFGYAQNATIKNVALENVEISGNTYVGALVGQADGGKIENCSISGTGNVKGNNYTGALVGVSSSALTSNTTNVAVSGVSYVGGLVGQSTGVLSKNYSTGAVSATTSQVGGLVGYNTSTISDSFALGSVTGSSYTGGLIGQNNGTLQRSYSSGKVKASSPFGGLVGTGTATNSYFDAISAQVDLTASNGFSYARLTNVMKKQETFATWDFANTWEIDTGASYPYLKNLAKPKNVTDGLPQDVVANGDGTAENPYLISTVAHLQNVKYDLSAYYKLTNDIDLQSVEWTPIGNNSAPFVGNFDGDNHQIKNIKVTGSKNYVGLFGYLQNATVKNVEVAGGNVSGNSYVSAITGYSQSSTINNAGASNVNVTGASYVSGIAGQADSSTIIGGYVSGNGSVKGTGYYVGAVAGWTNGTTITASYETVPVQGSIHYVGGLVGYSASGSDVISESYSTGNVIGGSSYSYTGGLVGYLNGKVKDSFSTSNVTGNAYIGGLVGAYGTVTNSYAAGTVVSSHSNKGAITGYSTSVTNSYFDTTKSGFTAPANMAKTTAMLLQQATFANWDFGSTWTIYEDASMPFLSQLPRPFDLVMITPKNITAKNITATSVEFSWNGVVEATQYEISYGTTILSTSDLKLKIDKLVPETEYKFKIRAKNDKVVGNWSNEIIVKTLFMPLTVVENVECVSKTYDKLNLTWDEVEAATSYIVTVDGAKFVTNENSITIEKLSENTEYSISVKAKNVKSEGIESEIVVFKTDYKPLDAPIIELIDKDHQSLSVSWNEVNKASIYEVTINDELVETSETSIVFSDLEPKTKYKIKVTAKNEFVGGIVSELEVKTYGLPLDKTEGLICLSKTDTSITLKWDSVTDASRYEIAYDGKKATSNENSITVNGLLPNTQYKFSVNAFNDDAKGVSSDELIVKTDFTPLPKSEVLAATYVGIDKITLAWAPVATATKYKVFYNGNVFETTETFCTIENLEANKEYVIYVVGENEDAGGTASNQIKAKTLPFKIMFVSKTSDSVALKWDSLTEMDYYEVFVNGESSTKTNDNFVTISNLTPKTKYTFKVQKVSPTGVKLLSDQIVVATPLDVAEKGEIMKVVQKGDSYNFALKLENSQVVSNTEFLLTYDPNELELEDFASQTKPNDKTIGKINNTDIEIISISEGIIKFKVNKQFDNNKTFSGVITVVKFKAKLTGDATIYFN